MQKNDDNCSPSDEGSKVPSSFGRLVGSSYFDYRRQDWFCGKLGGLVEDQTTCGGSGGQEV